MHDSVDPIAVSGSTAYWSTTSSIFRQASGDEPALLVEEPAIFLAATTDHLVWIGHIDPATHTYEVRHLRVATESTTTGGRSKGRKIGAGRCEPRGLALDETDAYFTGLCDGIVRVSWTGRAETVLPMDLDDPISEIAVDHERVYWVTDQGLWFMAKPQSAPRQLAKAEFAGAITVDQSHVYWTDGSCGFDCLPPSGTVRRIGRNGGPIVTLADKQSAIVALAVTSQHVFWRTELGAIRRVDKDGTGLTTLSQGHGMGSWLVAGPGVLYFETPETGPNRGTYPAGLYTLVAE